MTDKGYKVGLANVTVTALLFLAVSSPLMAQEPARGPLVLLDNKHRIVISVGDLLTVYDGSGRVIASGTFKGISADQLFFAGDRPQVVHVKYVSRLVYGARPFRSYVWSGLKYSAITGAAWVGGGVVIAFLTGMNDDGYYWLGLSLTAILVTPIPLAGNVLRGAGHQLRGQKYQIGGGHWQIATGS